MSDLKTDFIGDEQVTTPKISTEAKELNQWNAYKIQGTTIDSVGNGGTHPVMDSVGNNIIWDNASLEPSGFLSRAESTIAFEEYAREFSISPVGDHFDIYIGGQRFRKTETETTTILDTYGLWYIYYTSLGTLFRSLSIPDFANSSVVPVATVLWDTSGYSMQLSDERHGLTMSGDTHAYLHETRGMMVKEGIDAGDYTLLGDGTYDVDAQLSISDGVIADEDLEFNITDGASFYSQELAPVLYAPVFYRIGSGTQYARQATRSAPVMNAVSGRLLYNDNSGGPWGTVEAADNTYVVVWILATNDSYYPIISLLGQNESTTLSEARLTNLFDELDYDGLPMYEYKVMYRLIYHTSSSYLNTFKAVLRDITRVAPYNKSNPSSDILITKTIAAYIDQSFFNGNTGEAFIDISSGSWETITSFVYPGSTISTLNELKFILSRKGTSGTSYIRIYDLTNANTIAEFSYTSATEAVYTDSGITNLPTGESIFEIQAYASIPSGATRIHFLKVT